MRILLKKVTVASPAIPGQVDMLIQDGYITAIADNLTETADQVIDHPGLLLSPGWVDVFCQFHDTGAEHKETLETGTAAAAAGGFTDVFVVPNTQPAIHNKAQVNYIRQKGAALSANVHPLGAITKNGEGKELAEMYDMYASGAIAFTDGWHTLQSPQMMLKALQYVKTFGGVIVQLPDEPQLTKHGLVNEGIVSTQLGLPGKPALAESLMIARDLELLAYTNSRLHITGVSTAKSVELIKAAKAKGLQVTCSATPYHLFYTDEAVVGYDTNLKLNPPLRSAADVAALRQAVLDGTIDCITSHHYPQDTDNKVCEFEYACYGMEGLETSFRAVLSALPQLTALQVAQLFSTNARTIFRLPQVETAIGQAACFTLFSTTSEATLFAKHHLRSKSSNNAFVGNALAGQVFGIVRGTHLYLNP
jgi:dihydroorotase